MEPYNNLKKPLIASFFLLINFAHAFSASTPSSEDPTKTTFIVRPLLKEPPSSEDIYKKSHSVPAVAVSGTTKPNPQLKKICDKTDYPSLCLSSITPFFTGKTEIISVLRMAIDAAIKQTEVAISAAQKIVNSSNNPPETASILQDCIETYTDAIDNFHSAEEAIPEKDIGTINTMLSAAVADYETCNDESGGSSPMTSYGEKLVNMTSNCLVIASLIK
ncbi:pectinesterase inhibitor 1 [Ricinus communis]|uniref:Enzyme inhibitor, putative n=1 Tax=Ricinus communis TaxID=3988 RepID=B9RZP7_RICCO|nr:pectinesterase inhibitor 1 [Ricinus communis]EEF43080.1 enzyme inhibitor, putative [Ricinus communis]|eukprot:XP_025013118.1 pectinesterase inhibitor 1 [Ricinus communis]